MRTKENTNYITTIKNLLSRKGIVDRKHASTLAAILGLQYNSAKQKLDGKRGITFEELKAVFGYFNEPFDRQRAYNGVFIVNKLHKRCNISASSQPVTAIKANEHYAIKKNDLFIVDTNALHEKPDELYAIDGLEFLKEPRIAVLDNDNDILNLMRVTTQRYGIHADIFRQENDLRTAMTVCDYDAFVLDWLLDFDRTTESAIKLIREQRGASCPIIILTGQLNSHERSLSDMILKYDVSLIEKPAKPLIVSSLLLAHLFFS